jgi:hypothetical protein
MRARHKVYKYFPALPVLKIKVEEFTPRPIYSYL